MPTRGPAACRSTAIGKSRKVALSRLVIARRERSVAIMPLGRGLVVHTLNDPKELHDPAEAFTDIDTAKPDAAMVKLATQLVDRQTGRFDPADVTDRYEEKLREVIEAKLRGEEEPEMEEEPERDNVIDLMAALKRSLGKAPKQAARKAVQETRGKAAAKPVDYAKAPRKRPVTSKRRSA